MDEERFARDVLRLFFEYRDVHGFTEAQAVEKVVGEVRDSMLVSDED